MWCGVRCSFLADVVKCATWRDAVQRSAVWCACAGRCACVCLQVLIASLNVYLLTLDTREPLLIPESTEARVLEILILVFQASVAIHFLLVFGIGVYQAWQTLRNMNVQVTTVMRLQRWRNVARQRQASRAGASEPRRLIPSQTLTPPPATEWSCSSRSCSGVSHVPGLLCAIPPPPRLQLSFHLLPLLSPSLPLSPSHTHSLSHSRIHTHTLSLSCLT